MAKTRLNVSLDQDLVDFAKFFAAENRTTVSEVMTQFFLGLKRKANGEVSQQILEHPAFHDAMEEVKVRLRNGTATWQTFDEVFAD